MVISRVAAVCLTLVFFGALFVSNASAENPSCKNLLTYYKCPQQVANNVCSTYLKAFDAKHYYASCGKANTSVKAYLSEYQKNSTTDLDRHCTFMASGLLQTCLQGKKDYFK